MKLREVGRDPAHFRDPAQTWHELHDRFGTRATLLDRYALEAASRGIRAGQLSTDERARLTLEVTQAHWRDFEIIRGSDRTVDDRIEVVEYDPAWPELFEAWRARLAA